ncbi:glycerophosphodiester phosphodiesterase family protein [Haloarchaeobius sp. HME9146]|uniref:glycerophosphodiester phosphodiesterase n=1 Tax=Haloarchaeobius sp. HME9146 TaxID=2978732 RepID=UPI0021BEF5FF|nr:glycerophosphodiester phosphodiesterase family protein [Haloarchaeobius sp. HME9146]
MRLIAHRGFAEEAPENTVSAVEHAVAAGADVVEVDVRRCASGEVVVHHDETVDRVTDGSGAVADHTLAELQALSVLGSGQSVPSLAQVLDALPATIGVNVELKETGLAADVAALLADHEGEAMVSSFQEAALREMREADSTVPTAYLTDRFRDCPVSTARELGCSFVHPHYRLCLLSRLVERAHDAGMEVNVWTIRHGAIARLLAVRGVDGVTSDRSGILD